MIETRKFRFLIAPFFLYLSLGMGMYYDQCNSPLEKFLIDANDNINNAFIVLLGGGVATIAIGFLIGTTLYVTFRILVCLCGRWTHEVRLDSCSIDILKKQSKAVSDFERDSRHLFYLGANFDHHCLKEHKPGVHEWMARRWDVFSISSMSVIAFGLAPILGTHVFKIGGDASTNFYWQWLFYSLLPMALFFRNAEIAYRDAMGMLNLQIKLSHDKNQICGAFQAHKDAPTQAHEEDTTE